MKYIFIVLFVVLGFMATFGLQQRDEKLMSLCADHITKTLHECK